MFVNLSNNITIAVKLECTLALGLDTFCFFFNRSVPFLIVPFFFPNVLFLFGSAPFFCSWSKNGPSCSVLLLVFFVENGSSVL